MYINPSTGNELLGVFQKSLTVWGYPPRAPLADLLRVNETPVLEVSKPLVDGCLTNWKVLRQLRSRHNWVGRIGDQPEDFLVRNHRSPTSRVSRFVRVVHTSHSFVPCLKSHIPYIGYFGVLRNAAITKLRRNNLSEHTDTALFGAVDSRKTGRRPCLQHGRRVGQLGDRAMQDDLRTQKHTRNTAVRYRFPDSCPTCSTAIDGITADGPGLRRAGPCGHRIPSQSMREPPTETDASLATDGGTYANGGVDR